MKISFIPTSLIHCLFLFFPESQRDHVHCQVWLTGALHQEPGFDLRRCTSLVSWPSQKSLAWHPLLGIVISKVILESFFSSIPSFYYISHRSVLPGSSSWMGLCPMKRMYTKETPLPLLRVCSRMDVHNSASWTRHRYGDDVIHHAYRRRERGLKDQEDYVGVLNVLLLGGDPLA